MNGGASKSGDGHTPEMREAIAQVRTVSESKTSQKCIWMLWVRKERPNGLENVDLRSVSRTRELATLHAEIVKHDEPDATGIWIEERADNHLYGQRDVRLAFRLMNVSNKWVREEQEGS